MITRCTCRAAIANDDISCRAASRPPESCWWRSLQRLKPLRSLDGLPERRLFRLMSDRQVFRFVPVLASKEKALRECHAEG